MTPAQLQARLYAAEAFLEISKHVLRAAKETEKQAKIRVNELREQLDNERTERARCL